MDEAVVKARQLAHKIVSNIEQVIIGKPKSVELAVI